MTSVSRRGVISFHTLTLSRDCPGSNRTTIIANFVVEVFRKDGLITPDQVLYTGQNQVASQTRWPGRLGSLEPKFQQLYLVNLSLTTAAVYTLYMNVSGCEHYPRRLYLSVRSVQRPERNGTAWKLCGGRMAHGFEYSPGRSLLWEF